MIVFLDIDDTLISGDSGPFSDDIAAIEKSRKGGHLFFLCTGRSLANIPPLIRDASWVDGMVSGGGAHVLIGGKTIYHKWVSVPVLCEISGLFLAKGKQCTFRGDKNLYVINKLREERIPITAPDDFAVKYPDARISMMTADLTMGPQERALLERHFNFFAQPRHYDCFMKSEGKARGMGIVLETLHLDRKDSAAIGDSTNDLDIIAYAGTGIAVGNACAELKEKASWISAPVGEGAAAKALEYLGLC